MEIRQIDLGDADAGDAWYEVYSRAVRCGIPSAMPWLRSDIAEQFKPNLRRDASAWAALVDGVIVGVGTIEVPLLDNTHACTIGVYTAPERRRRGYGSRLLSHLETLARDAGRRVAHAEIDYPADGPEDGHGSPGPDFAVRHGYRFGLAEIMRAMPVPVACSRLDELAAEAARAHPDYRLETFVGTVPDAWVSDYVRLESRISSDAPSGTLEVEAASADVGPFREGEQRTERQGRESYIAVALHDERVVGFTKVAIARSEPTVADQWGTLVDPAHRGHRLGLGLKVANLRQLQEREPQLRSIVTWNAESNAPMIGVNELLGYVPVHRGGQFEKRWDQARASTATT